METDLYVLRPNTPSAMRLTLSALSEMLSGGQIQASELCLRESDGVTLTVGEAVASKVQEAAPKSTARLHLSMPAEKAPAKEAFGGNASSPAPKLHVSAQAPESYHLGQDEEPKERIHSSDRDYLLRHDLISSRLISSLTRKQARGMVLRHKLRVKLVSLLRLLILIAILGGAIYCLKNYQPERWEQIVQFVKNIGQKDAGGEPSDKSKKDASPNTAVQDKAAMQKADFNFYKNKVGILHERAHLQTNPMASYVGCGAVGLLNGVPYFFVPISVISQLTNPGALLLSGRELNLQQMPMVYFGSLDLIGFQLKNGADAFVMGKPITASLLTLRGVGQNPSSKKPDVAFDELEFERTRDGYLDLALKDRAPFVGYVLTDVNNTGLCGIMTSDAMEEQSLGYAVDLTKLPSPAPITWEQLQKELKLFSKIKLRTDSFANLSKRDVKIDDIADSSLRVLLISAAQKLRAAEARKTKSLRDPSKIFEDLEKDMMNLIASDIEAAKFTLPFFAQKASACEQMRRKSFSRVQSSLKRQQMPLDVQGVK